VLTKTMGPLPRMMMAMALGMALVGVKAGYSDPRDTIQDYHELVESIHAEPEVGPAGQLGEMTLYEILDFAETIEDPEERARVEKFASSMQVMLKILDKDPTSTKMSELRALAARQSEKIHEEKPQGDAQDAFQNPLAALLGEDMQNPDFEKIRGSIKPMMKAFGLSEEEFTDEKIKEMYSQEGIQKTYDQLMGNLGMGAGGNSYLNDLFSHLPGNGNGKFVYSEWVKGLSEKDQRALNGYLQGEVPETLEELKQISKQELQKAMKPLSANRIWRYIQVGSSRVKRPSGPLGSITSELEEVMSAMDKNPRMKEYSQRFLDTLSKGDASVHEKILELTKEMQDDPQVKMLAEKLKGSGPIQALDGLKDTMGGVKDEDFKVMLEQMSQMGLPGMDKSMLNRLDDIDMPTLKSEYTQMMDALLAGKDLSTLHLPAIDKLMGRVRDDL